MFWESIIIALEGLRANKLRSMLTMLGIIIGVGAVIAMVSIGMGVRDKCRLYLQPGQQLVDRIAWRNISFWCEASCGFQY